MDLDQVYWIRVYFKIEGVELLVQKESISASVGAKVVPSLQRADPSYISSVTGSICRAKCSHILQDISTGHRSKIVDTKFSKLDTRASASR